MKTQIILLMAIAYVLSTPVPPIWGGKPQFQVTVNISGAKIQPYQMIYQYDSIANSSKYINIAPEYDEVCSTFSDAPSAYLYHNCTLVFSYDDWFYINYPSDNWCCKCAKCGYLVPDWLKTDSLFKGELTINGRKCNWWAKKGYELNNYCSEVGTDMPVRYWESVSGPTIAQWDFQLETYKVTQFEKSNFAPPSSCSTLCGGTCAEFRKMATE